MANPLGNENKNSSCHLRKEQNTDSESAIEFPDSEPALERYSLFANYMQRFGGISSQAGDVATWSFHNQSGPELRASFFIRHAFGR